MAFHRTLLVLIASLVLADFAFAQSTIDPSSALLLNPSGRGSTGRSSEKATIESRSERYTVRPRAATEKTTVKETVTVKRVVTEPVTQPTPAPVVLQPTEQGAVVVNIDPPVSTKTPIETKLSEAQGVSEPIEPGRHLLEISIATAYLYENAESNYSFRQANMGGPAYSANARAWLVSEFAIGGQYLSTLGGQVADRGTAVSASRTEIAYGIYLRKHFAASNMVFAIEYVDSSFKVSSDAVSKLKTKSSGVRVAIDAEFQSTPTSSWTVGFSAMPKLQHEESAAATEVRSGTSVNAYAVSASLARSWKFDSSHSVFVRLEHRLERDLFTGAATLPDPIGQATPNGVAATIGTTLIQFGYGWGD